MHGPPGRGAQNYCRHRRGARGPRPQGRPEAYWRPGRPSRCRRCTTRTRPWTAQLRRPAGSGGRRGGARAVAHTRGYVLRPDEPRLGAMPWGHALGPAAALPLALYLGLAYLSRARVDAALSPSAARGCAGCGPWLPRAPPRARCRPRRPTPCLKHKKRRAVISEAPGLARAQPRRSGHFRPLPAVALFTRAVGHPFGPSSIFPARRSLTNSCQMRRTTSHNSRRGRRRAAAPGACCQRAPAEERGPPATPPQPAQPSPARLFGPTPF